jgi:four helix bundle protein
MLASRHRFRDLKVWVESVALARDIYRLTSGFPATERYGLAAQLCRAAVSVPSNIAEGSVRRSRQHFRHYLEIALGSLAEIETQLEIAVDFRLDLGLRDKVQDATVRIRRMLYRLIAHLDSNSEVDD